MEFDDVVKLPRIMSVDYQTPTTAENERQLAVISDLYSKS